MSYRRSSTRSRVISRENSLKPPAFKRQHSVTPPPDVIDDEPEPSAPSLELLDLVAGYENVSFETSDVPPPLVPSPPVADEESHRGPLPSGPVITEAEARHALLKHVSQRCCYGKSAARDMAVTSIEHSSAFHYTLETFSEKRQTSWAFEPYTGGPVDNSKGGLAPGPWEIPANPSSLFQNSTCHIEVPRTSSVKMCHTCGGVGRKRCFTCSGNGWEYCQSCHGDGQKSKMQGEVERCFQCHGTGRKKCWKCNGDGLACCRACGGTGQIKCFIQLSVSWINRVDDHVAKSSALPDDKIKLVTGQLVFTEERPSVFPINHFPDSTVNLASAQLVQKHATSFPLEKIIMQRHRIRIVPVATVHFHWRGEDSSFIVFGFERKIFAPDYPQKCCCCCNIL